MFARNSPSHLHLQIVCREVHRSLIWFVKFPPQYSHHFCVFVLFFLKNSLIRISSYLILPTFLGLFSALLIFFFVLPLDVFFVSCFELAVCIIPSFSCQQKRHVLLSWVVLRPDAHSRRMAYAVWTLSVLLSPSDLLYSSGVACSPTVPVTVAVRTESLVWSSCLQWH